MLSIAWAMGQPPQGGQAGAPDIFMSFLPLMVIFIIFYFLMIRPQQTKAKAHREMLAAVKKGDKVITTGGIYAVVESVDESTVTLKISENVKVKFGKSFITTIRGSHDGD
ncbi:MAG: preprotein translocase subunit YajC [Nitrospirae bacterium]|nr:preprotein translocase subunit YajC [Nitrospirota bacterium]MBF0534232.1 preprotein translocase subunit YajC [Nitrospirota bacterium]MBF0615854.1 preprotein translocase subunit YajC [Nitrospirota bacterium]